MARKLTYEQTRLRKAAAERKATLKGVKELVKLFAANPQLELPYNFGNVTIFAQNVDKMLAIAKQIGGKFDKDVTESYFNLRKPLGGAAKLDITVSRGQVCTKRVTGTKTIPGYTVPDQVVEVVEWDCPPALSALVAQAGK